MIKQKDMLYSIMEYKLTKGMEPDINVDDVSGKPITSLQSKCRNFLTVYRDMEKQNGMGFHLIIPQGHPWYGFLDYLFSTSHNHWQEKTHGDSIKYFYVGRSTYKHGKEGTPCFFFVLEHLPTDYNENHLGFSSLTAKPRSKRTVVQEACRNAVRPDIERFKQQELAKLMARGEYYAFSDYHVHHAGKSFETIFEEWAEAHGGIDYLYEQVLPTEQSGFETRFKDVSLSKSFRNYHNDVATLILLTAEEHHAVHHHR